MKRGRSLHCLEMYVISNAATEAHEKQARCREVDMHTEYCLSDKKIAKHVYRQHFCFCYPGNYIKLSFFPGILMFSLMLCAVLSFREIAQW